MRSIILIAHNLRSTHNVGALLRTADGLGISKVILSGYTPYPALPDDRRLPHLSLKIDRQIAKTALGAEKTVRWEHCADLVAAFSELAAQGYQIVALEQAASATALPAFQPPEKLALLVGREVEGIEPEVLSRCHGIVEIPMFGRKESFNVVHAAAMALYHCRFIAP